MQIGFIVILIIAIFVAIFAIQNGTPVPIDLFFARYEMPLAVIMMFCLILGAVIVLVLGTTRQFKRRSEQKELKNRIKTFEAEKAQEEDKLKALEAEKIQMETEVTALQEEKESLENSKSQLMAKVTELEEKLLKTESKNEIEEITEEGVAQINNENSEVESQ